MSPIHSSYQTAIFSDPDSSKRIDGVAGCGKTYVLVELAKSLQPGGNYVFLAFNKTIAEELKSRLPYYVHASTFHALGRSLLPSFRLRKFRTSDFFKDMVDNKTYFANFKNVTTVVSSWKNSMPTAEVNPIDLADCIDQIDLDCDNEADLLQWCSEIIVQSADYSNGCDFDDMLWLPVVNNLPFPKVDRLFVDEAQDLNLIQHEFIQRCLHSDSQLTIVGDPFQAIYGFRGADTESLDKLTTRFALKHFPLSITYRCPTAIVTEAKPLVPHLESAPDAASGQVRKLGSTWSPDSFPNAAAILCRNHAPLVMLALRLLSAGRPFSYAGRDLGSGLEKIVRSFRADDMIEYKTKLDFWRDKKLVSAKTRAKQGVIEDKHQVLSILSSGCTTPSEILTKIDQIFLPNKNALILSTIHRAKGLEWNNVFILNEFLLPSKYAKTEAELQQENNLRYVAITRSKENLTYISI